MNKKFSTLVAGFALFGAMSVSAAINPVASLQQGDNDGLYQLKTDGDSVLVMNKYGTLVLEEASSLTSLANSLWCVKVTEQGFGKAPVFDFTNKATGQRLDIAYTGSNLVKLPGSTQSTDSTVVGGEIFNWAFSSQYKNDVEPATLYSYFKADSVLGLARDADTIRIVKESAREAYADRSAGAIFQKFTLSEADSLELDAATINTFFGQQDADKGVKLKFEEDQNGVTSKNYFTDDAKFTADTTMDATGANVDKWVRILTGKPSDSTYVYVDTAYVNSNGQKFLGFATKQFTAAKLKGTSLTDTLGLDPVTGLNDQAKFLFTYWPSKDSLVIQVKKVTHLHDGNKWFNESTAITGDTLIAESSLDARNFVTVQDLVTADDIRIVTIDNQKETEISFGYESCVPMKSDRTTLAPGLYFIMNQEGQYLASPIHVNGAAAQWVTVKASEQLPAHMPAYQWAVTQTQTNSALAPTSPNAVTNREFEGLNETIQVYKTVGAKYWTATSTMIPATDSLYFVQVKEAEGVKGNATLINEAYKDPYLGYKKIKDAEFLLEKYNFKYLHPYAIGENSKYLAKGEGADSVLNVLNGPDKKDAFRLIEKPEANYGYNPASSLGFVRLKRASYRIQLDEAYMDSIPENKYGMTKYVGGTPDAFFLKENNHYEGDHYYAIVLADNNNLGKYKAGVTDDILDASMKVQPIGETRTSAFAISEDKTPLYRRFNNAALGENNGIDSLRFYENKRGEFLMDENNNKWQNEGVDYLGIWTEDHATGLALQVNPIKTERDDIKPQYLISVASQYVPAVDTIPCKEGHNHQMADGTPTTDANKCFHATPGKPAVTIAKYLVSFEDSISASRDAEKDLPYLDVAKGYTRVGFVKAIHQGDSLYILANGFEKMSNDKLVVTDIVANYRANGIYHDYVKELKKKDHKNYTWSFRYVHPEEAADVTTEGPSNSFLIESMAYPENAAGEYSASGSKKAIAPNVAAWIKMQNQCLMLTDKSSSFSNAKTGGDGALIFNVDNVANDELATDNEEVSASSITIEAGEGQVTIAGAQGKKVIISNVLGQVLTETVVASDNAVINVPAGIVVVAVDGAKAQKAIVK